MTLKNWMKYIDPIINVEIYGSDQLLYEGPMFDIPWTLVDYPIGRDEDTKEDFNEEPIFICQKTNEYNVTLPYIVINIKDNNNIKNDKKGGDFPF